jgi:hypothetical protein
MVRTMILCRKKLEKLNRTPSRCLLKTEDFFVESPFFMANTVHVDVHEHLQYMFTYFACFHVHLLVHVHAMFINMYMYLFMFTVMLIQ